MTHRHCVNSCICFLVVLSNLTLIRCYFGTCRKYNFVVSVTDLPAPASRLPVARTELTDRLKTSEVSNHAMTDRFIPRERSSQFTFRQHAANEHFDNYPLGKYHFL